MNAANSPGARSCQSRAVIGMTSTASKPAASVSGRLAACVRRASMPPACDTSLTIPSLPPGGRVLRGLPGASRGLARGEPDAVGDTAQMLVGEPVAMAAQLAGQHPLAEPLPTRCRVLADRAGIPQQSRARPSAVAVPGHLGCPAQLR